jgi:hypothetical protein
VNCAEEQDADVMVMENPAYDPICPVDTNEQLVHAALHVITPYTSKTPLELASVQSLDPGI